MHTLSTRIKIGVAGWTHPPGGQHVRACGESHLEYYADRFACVEVNSSFYRAHRPATYLAWRRATPRSFKFSVKMPRAITHEGALRGVRRELRQFLASIEPLGDKLGAILIQLPPQMAFDPRTTRSCFERLPEWGSAFYACEPRHASWFLPAAGDLMERHGIARVAADPARAAGADLPAGSAEHAYFRWHGSPRMYYSSYTLHALRTLATQLAVMRGRGPWCIFDNTARHAAWGNAATLCKLLERR